VVQRASRRDHDAAGHVTLRVEGAQLLARDRAHDLSPADHRPAEWMWAEHRAAEQIEDAVLRVVFVHRDLLEHDLALGLQLAEARLPHHVAHDLERPRQVAIENTRVDRRRLLVGAGVDVGAHRVEDLVDLLRAEARAAAEKHVLEQV